MSPCAPGPPVPWEYPPSRPALSLAHLAHPGLIAAGLCPCLSRAVAEAGPSTQPVADAELATSANRSAHSLVGMAGRTRREDNPHLPLQYLVQDPSGRARVVSLEPGARTRPDGCSCTTTLPSVKSIEHLMELYDNGFDCGTTRVTLKQARMTAGWLPSCSYIEFPLAFFEFQSGALPFPCCTVLCNGSPLQDARLAENGHAAVHPCSRGRGAGRGDTARQGQLQELLKDARLNISGLPAVDDSPLPPNPPCLD